MSIVNLERETVSFKPRISQVDVPDDSQSISTRFLDKVIADCHFPHDVVEKLCGALVSTNNDDIILCGKVASVSKGSYVFKDLEDRGISKSQLKSLFDEDQQAQIIRAQNNRLRLFIVIETDARGRRRVTQFSVNETDEKTSNN